MGEFGSKGSMGNVVAKGASRKAGGVVTAGGVGRRGGSKGQAPD